MSARTKSAATAPKLPIKAILAALGLGGSLVMVAIILFLPPASADRPRTETFSVAPDYIEPVAPARSFDAEDPR